MKKNNLTYIGSIKKMSNNSVEIVLTNKVYNFTHVMWTNFDEILLRARSLVPKLLSMTSASVSVDDNVLIKCLPEMIELREREEEEEEEEKEESQSKIRGGAHSLILGFKETDDEIRVRDERARQRAVAVAGGDDGDALVKKLKRKRSDKTLSRTRRERVVEKEKKMEKMEEKEEKEEEEEKEFHEELGWDFVLHLMEEEMIDGGKKLQRASSIIGIHMIENLMRARKKLKDGEEEEEVEEEEEEEEVEEDGEEEEEVVEEVEEDVEERGDAGSGKKDEEEKLKETKEAWGGDETKKKEKEEENEITKMREKKRRKKIEKKKEKEKIDKTEKEEATVENVTSASLPAKPNETNTSTTTNNNNNSTPLHVTMVSPSSMNDMLSQHEIEEKRCNELHEKRRERGKSVVKKNILYFDYFDYLILSSSSSSFSCCLSIAL